MSVKADSKTLPGSPWAYLGLGLLVWAGCFTFWLNAHETGAMRQQLMSVVPVFFWIILAVLVIALMMNARAIREFAATIPKRDWLGLVLVMGLGLFLVKGVAPQTHRVYYDEDIYQAIGLNIAHNNKAAMTLDGRWDYGHFKSLRMEYNKQPNAWPFLLNLTYRLFGVSEGVSFGLTHILFAFSILAVFICGVLLFERSGAGLLGAALYATIPENVLWYSTTAAEPSTACFSLLAIAATLLFFKTRTSQTLFLATSIWALAVQFRPETILLMGVVGTMFYIDGWDESQKPKTYGFLLLFLVLISAHLTHLLVMRGESWGSTTGDKLSLNYLTHNLKTNVIYYFDGHKFPILFSFLALAGSFFPGSWKSRLYTILWFLVSWGVFIFFYAGSYQYGSDVRFSLLSMAPIALLAGRGLWHLLVLSKKLGPGMPYALAVLLIGLNLMFYAPLMRANGQESWPSRNDHTLAEAFAKHVPDNGIVMTHNPNMFHIWGKNAAQMSLSTEYTAYSKDVIEQTFKDKVFLHWNYWCNVPVPVQRSFCDNIFARFKTEPVQEWHQKDSRLGLYRVVGINEAYAAPNTPARQSKRP